MAIEITIPRLGWSMEEGTFAAWLKNGGETVEAGEPLFSVESDKVTMDVESLDGGVLYLPPGTAQPGEIVKVGQVVGYLLAAGEPVPGEAVAVTPRARRVAAEQGVDVTSLRGSGKGGRIREQDVRGAVAAAKPVSPTRRAIAKRMMESQAQTAPVTLTRRVDASRLVALRNRWKLALGESPAPSYTDLVAKLVGIALGSHPALAGRWDGDQIVLPEAIHVGIAVDTRHGLVAPVIRNVAEGGLLELAARSRALIAAAHRRELRAEDLEGSVFTISNLGNFGVEFFTPIINFPETAVLGMGTIRWEPVVLNSGQIVARELLPLSLTFDHRVVDGAPAARFLGDVAALIEEPPAAVHCP
ncbi:MAG: dihydrolipoamide acetyltransferase family protein [Bryobacteraceae bacterium]|nr:dihydrolipoamide acetyltransferase family protein [Bryobacteraceae bacterium]